MITSDIELRQSVEQLDRMYRVLADLHSRMAASNPANFQLFAEGPIDEIRRLRRDIDTYLGIGEVVPAGHPS